MSCRLKKSTHSSTNPGLNEVLLLLNLHIFKQKWFNIAFMIEDEDSHRLDCDYIFFSRFFVLGIIKYLVFNSVDENQFWLTMYNRNIHNSLIIIASRYLRVLKSNNNQVIIVLRSMVVGIYMNVI